MIIRSILTGSAWREYQKGCREICGVKLPEGMCENQRFPEPIITPTTKADEGHDMNISKEEIIAQGIVSAEDYAVMEDYTRRIFQRGQEIAAKQGLILVDTKYEFGKRDGKVYLIDEIHTPDSSRYFYADGYEEKFEKGEPQRQLSKEFVRQWLIEHNFMNEPGQTMPEITDEYAESVSGATSGVRAHHWRSSTKLPRKATLPHESRRTSASGSLHTRSKLEQQEELRNGSLSTDIP